MEGRLLYFSILIVAGSYGALALFDGEPIKIEKVPYMGIIYDDVQYTCFATIIGDSWFVTTAECMQGYKANELKIQVGADDAYTGLVYKVNKIVTHPQHVAGTQDFNYALLNITGKLKWTKKIKAAKLPSARPKSGTTLTVSSYGSPDFDGNLRKGNMNVITNAKCKSIYKGLVDWIFTKRVGCLYNPGRTTLCDGEFAAPAVKDNTLYYIMSTYDPTPSECENTAHPTLMADITTVVSWISKVTGIKP